uniref:interleukin-20 receptor subunit beta n=1 Tax=Maylandia zebra TaxID=106582 RepID=UPI000D320BFE|nr:interleukin-20 receptor subunit beta-like [Maylandia zebra]
MTVSLLLLMMTLLNFTNDVWTLPAPGSVFMESVDMRHMLRWPPLQASCNTTLLYSVQYQGEFELEHQNGRWMEAPGCQRITLSHCDLTSDLGSDSDYNIRLRAHCGSQRSAWTKLRPPFNRRQTETYRQAGREKSGTKGKKEALVLKYLIESKCAEKSI